jgi:ribosome-associated heat shock protein Hsp15
MRLDKWLWAARYFKTRSLATDAVDGGKVKVNGCAAKPARDVKAGDRLRIRPGDEDWEVVVIGLSEQRRPAAEARLLYQETAESQLQRSRAMELRKLDPVPAADQKGRPTKRDRRQWLRLQEH